MSLYGGLWCDNALQAASCRGHKRVVKMLLDRDANLNPEGRYRNALRAAYHSGYYKVKQILLKRRARNVVDAVAPPAPDEQTGGKGVPRCHPQMCPGAQDTTTRGQGIGLGRTSGYLAGWQKASFIRPFTQDAVE